MYVNLFDIPDGKLLLIAKQLDQCKPQGQRSSILETIHLGIFENATTGVVSTVLYDWGLAYEAHKDDRLPWEKNAAISIHIRRHDEGSPRIFRSGYLFCWDNMTWWDVCRTMLASEVGSFWVDVPDDF